MRKLFTTAALSWVLLAAPVAASASDPCEPDVVAARDRVFAELAERGIRVAGITGAGGLTEHLHPRDTSPACPAAAPAAPVAGVTTAGGITVR